MRITMLCRASLIIWRVSMQIDAIYKAVEVFDALLDKNSAKLDLADFGVRFRLDEIRQELIKITREEGFYDR